MRRERVLLSCSIVLNLGLVILMIHEGRKHRAATQMAVESRMRIEHLSRQLAEAEAGARKQSASQASITNAEVLELARLRNEVTRLRSEQRAAAGTNSIAGRRPTAPAPVLPLPPARPITKLTSTVSAQVPLGHALALGGWAGSEPGQRIVGFITPATAADSPGAVLLETRLVSLPDRLLDRLGLQDLRTDEAGSQGAAGLDPARLAALLKLAEQEAGVSILSSPRVLTANGQPATVSVTQAQSDGTHTGPVIKLTPTLDATGNSVRLDVGLELNLPASRP